MGVVPMAYHQPVARPDGPDARASTTLLREIYEELFHGEETTGTVFEQHAGIAELRGAARIELTGFTLNLVNGNYDFNLLLAVEDPGFWKRWARAWSRSWEAEQLLVVSSRDTARLRELIESRDWVPQSLVSLLEGLKRLDIHI
jgi:hypothetical protein